MLDKEKLWVVLNSNIVSGLVVLLLTIFISVWIIDRYRAWCKRKTLLLLVLADLENIPKSMESNSKYIRMCINDYFYKGLLSSDVFNYQKDKKLLISLHKLCSTIEMFNFVCVAGNQEVISGENISGGMLKKGSNLLLDEIAEHKDIVSSQINKKYKINFQETK